MRGVILAIVPDGSYGQLSAEDGQRYSYWTKEVRNGRVQVGQTVEFQLWEGQPIDIFAVQTPAPPRAPQRPQPPPQMTTRAALDRPKEIVDTYVDLGCRAMFVRPVDPFGFARLTADRIEARAEGSLRVRACVTDGALELHPAGILGLLSESQQIGRQGAQVRVEVSTDAHHERVDRLVDVLLHGHWNRVIIHDRRPRYKVYGGQSTVSTRCRQPWTARTPHLRKNPGHRLIRHAGRGE